MSNSKRWADFMHYWSTVKYTDYKTPEDMWFAISQRIQQIKDGEKQDNEEVDNSIPRKA